MSDKIELRAEVPSELGGQRLDQVAAQLFAEHSRSRLSAWIKDGRLTVDGAVIRPRDIVHGGAILELTAEQEAQGEWVAQDIALDIVYEDATRGPVQQVRVADQGETFPVRAGDLVRNRPGGTHALENPGPGELRLFVFELGVRG